MDGQQNFGFRIRRFRAILCQYELEWLENCKI